MTQHLQYNTYKKQKNIFYKLFFFICFISNFTFFAGQASCQDTELPLCPSSLNRKNVEFEEQIKKCNYDRRLLPPCEKGLASLDVENNKVNRKRTNCTKEWTIIVFIAGDDEKLNHYAEMDMEELFYAKAEDIENHFDLAVEIDTFATESKRYAFEKTNGEDKISAIRPKDFLYEGEQNTGDPKVLKDFLAWAIESFPSRHYMLIIGGHGDGWASLQTNSCEISRELHRNASNCSSSRHNEIPKDQDFKKNNIPNFVANDHGNQKDNQTMALNNLLKNSTVGVTRLGKGIAYDASHDDWLNITQLKQLLTSTRKIFMGGAKFDLYAADACLMQQAEVAFELREQASFIYGSLSVFPAQGLPYDSILKNFSSQKYTKEDISTGVEILAQELPRLVQEYYNGLENPEIQKKLIISVIKTADLERSFLSELNNLGNIGLKWLEEEAKKGSNLIEARMAFRTALSKQVSFQYSVYDMKSMLYTWEEILENNNEFSQNKHTKRFIEQIQTMNKVLEDSIISSVIGENYKNFTVGGGLSIWLPQDSIAYDSLLPYIARSSLHRYSNHEGHSLRNLNYWSLFLKKLFFIQRPSE